MKSHLSRFFACASHAFWYLSYLKVSHVSELFLVVKRFLTCQTVPKRAPLRYFYRAECLAVNWSHTARASPYWSGGVSHSLACLHAPEEVSNLATCNPTGRNPGAQRQRQVGSVDDCPVSWSVHQPSTVNRVQFSEDPDFIPLHR